MNTLVVILSLLQTQPTSPRLPPDFVEKFRTYVRCLDGAIMAVPAEQPEMAARAAVMRACRAEWYQARQIARGGFNSESPEASLMSEILDNQQAVVLVKIRQRRAGTSTH